MKYNRGGRQCNVLLPRIFVLKSAKVSKEYTIHYSVLLFRTVTLFLFLSSHAVRKTRTDKSLSWPQIDGKPSEYYCDVIIEAFNIDRFPLLSRIIYQYRACHCIRSIYLRTNFSAKTTQAFLHDVHPSTYEIVMTRSKSLNERFRRPTLSTSSCVIISDDDILVSVDDLLLLHEVWLSNPYSLVGPFSRKVSLSRVQGTDIVYEDSSSEYNLLLTKLLVVHKAYMDRYHSKSFRDLRSVVDQFQNCEDIAMNIVASLLNGYPIHVDIQPMDLGDSRNDKDLEVIKRNGLGMRTFHWAKRHECFQHIFRLYPHIPRLQNFSVVRFAGDHSLCHHAEEQILCRDIPSK